MHHWRSSLNTFYGRKYISESLAKSLCVTVDFHSIWKKNLMQLVHYQETNSSMISICLVTQQCNVSSHVHCTICEMRYAHCAHIESRDFWLERSSVICRSLSNRLLFSILLVRNWTGGEQCSRCACTLHNKSELNWIECIAEFPSKRLIAAQKQTTTLFEMATRRYTEYGNLFN